MRCPGTSWRRRRLRPRRSRGNSRSTGGGPSTSTRVCWRKRTSSSPRERTIATGSTCATGCSPTSPSCSKRESTGRFRGRTPITRRPRSDRSSRGCAGSSGKRKNRPAGEGGCVRGVPGWGEGGYRGPCESRSSVLLSRGGEPAARGVRAYDGPLVPGPDRGPRPLRVRSRGGRSRGEALGARGEGGASCPRPASRVETGGGRAAAFRHRAVGPEPSGPDGRDRLSCRGEPGTCPVAVPGADQGLVGGGGGEGGGG